MAEVSFESGNVLDFQGDAVICFCDCDLTYKGYNFILQKINSKKLLEELSAIGYCEMGNAVITKSYHTNLSNYLFVPCLEQKNHNNYTNYILLHKGLRAAFSLANLYKAKRIAILISTLRVDRKDNVDKKEVENIIMTVVSEVSKRDIEEVYIYH